MRNASWLLVVPILLSCAAHTAAGDPPPKAAAAAEKKDEPKKDELKAEEVKTKGAVAVGGKQIAYTAIAGSLLIKPHEEEDEAQPAPPEGKGEKPITPTAQMTFVAYVAGEGKDTNRPLVFLYNGGPGSATIWLHMGAFGPKRVATVDAERTVAPYKFTDNPYSLLDVADLVFIDAPGTGFGKIIGKDKEKTFWGVDADAEAFAEFIPQFLTKYGRWESPKYLFGESYGTTRSAVLAAMLEADKGVTLDGVILLSQILMFDIDADGAEYNPGVDLAYQLTLPTYAATAWYHKKLPDAPPQLETFLAEVEQFAMTDYALALGAGNSLDPAKRKAIAEKLHRYTGLPVEYIEKANLRVTGPEFSKTLRDDNATTVGRLDTRYAGPTFDRLSKNADYDPQSAAISGPYIAAYNEYARKTLKFGDERKYKQFVDVFKFWNWDHKFNGFALPHTTNVMSDLAAAMVFNPNLRVQLEAGYYDLATPFYQGVYELNHLVIPQKLQSNISMKFYPAGHMIYQNEQALKQLHDNVAAFIRAKK